MSANANANGNAFYTADSNDTDWQDSEGNRLELLSPSELAVVHKLTINARREVLLEVQSWLKASCDLGEADRTQDLMQDLENADELQENIKRIIDLWRKG
jgi:hypothetical protein